MRTAADQAIERLAATQHGTFARAQVLDAGLTTTQLRRRLHRGTWHRLAPGVYTFPGLPDSIERRCWVAWLHAGPEALLSHSTAARLHGLAPVPTGPVELVVGRSATRSLPGTVRHRPRPWAPARVRWYGGLPATDPARTIVDLSASLSRGRLERVVEHAEVHGICDHGEVGAELTRVRRRGVDGVRRLEAVLDELAPGGGVPRSELERIGDEVRRAAGLPEPRHEHPLPSSGGRPGFVDRAWPEAMLIAEYDGRRWHSRRSQFALDRQRDLEASALGWLTLRLTWEQLRHDPDGTARAWREVHDRRRRLLADA